METVLAAATRPLGPVATAIVAGIIITFSVVVVVGYVVFAILMRRAPDRQAKESSEESSHSESETR